MKRRSPLDPESSRTLIVLFLTFMGEVIADKLFKIWIFCFSLSPKLMLGSGILAQSKHVFLLFGFKLVHFSSNFFNLDTNFIGIGPFLDFWEGFLDPQVFSSGKLALFAFWQEGFSFLRLALRNLHLFLLKMLITTTTAVTLPVFAVSIAISSAFVVSLRAVLVTLIRWGLWDE